MKNPQLKSLLLTVSIGILTAVLLVRWNKEAQEKNYKELTERLRSQIKQELKEEVRNEVLQEIPQLVKAQIKHGSDASTKIAEIPSVQKIAQPQSPPSDFLSKTNNEDLQTAVHQIVLEILDKEKQRRQLLDQDLDQYAASGDVEPGLQVGPGMSKSPVKDRRPGKAVKKDDKDLDVAGGTTERTESLERTLQQRGSILLGKGKMQVEPSFTYAHSSANTISIQGFSILPVLVVGDIDVQKIKRDVFIETLSAKYGLFDNFQTELKIPYRGEFDRTVLTSTTAETTRGTQGLGDIEFGVSRQIGWEHGLMPDLVANFSVKPPTGREPYNHDIGLGTGHWGLRGSLIAAKSSDPAVIFGSLSYTYNFARQDIENFGDVKPGDTLGYSVGTAIALSYQTAITFSFDQSITTKMVRNDNSVGGSFLNVANFKTGVNWAIDEYHSLDFGVSMGLTTDAPDMTVDVRFPITF